MGKTPPPNRSILYTARPKGWRSMDTAPQDGTRVLLRCLDGDAKDRSASKSVSIGHWDKHEVFGVPSPDWYNDAGHFLEPDGWLPLPPVDD
jgi:hypothetical protein